MLGRIFLLVGMITALSLVSGCQNTDFTKRESTLKENWGRSFKEAKENQILNPEAGKDPNPVIGMDGQAANSSMEKYRGQFEEKDDSESIYNINLQDILKQ